MLLVNNYKFFNLNIFLNPIRLMVFWSDMIAGKRVIKSSRILIQGKFGSAEVLDSFHEQACAGGNLRGLSVAMFPTTIGQLIVGEQSTSKGYVIIGVDYLCFIQGFNLNLVIDLHDYANR